MTSRLSAFLETRVMLYGLTGGTAATTATVARKR